MTKIVLLNIAAIFFCYSVAAQPPAWEQVQYAPASCTVSFPGMPTYVDTLGVRMYSYEMDSTYALTAHFMRNVFTDPGPSSLMKSAMTVEQDSLRGIAQVLRSTTNAQVLAISDHKANGQRDALDITLRYPDMATNGTPLAYTRLVYEDGIFMAFTVSGWEADTTQLSLVRAQYFGSINIPAP